MPNFEDTDCDELIARLVGLLPPPDRVAFRRVAEEALARASCWSAGAVYRAIAGMQRTILDPPAFGRVGWARVLE
jgi:hypothetical protein